MSDACGITHIGVFSATYCNFMKSVYVPVGAVENSCPFRCVSTPGMLAQVSLVVGVRELQKAVKNTLKMVYKNVETRRS
jgi:hypothetical protein